MPEPAWRHEGTEPDYRFTLANERTFADEQSLLDAIVVDRRVLLS